MKRCPLFSRAIPFVGGRRCRFLGAHRIFVLPGASCGSIAHSLLRLSCLKSESQRRVPMQRFVRRLIFWNTTRRTPSFWRQSEMPCFFLQKEKKIAFFGSRQVVRCRYLLPSNPGIFRLQFRSVLPPQRLSRGMQFFTNLRSNHRSSDFSLHECFTKQASRQNFFTSFRGREKRSAGRLWRIRVWAPLPSRVRRPCAARLKRPYDSGMRTNGGSTRKVMRRRKELRWNPAVRTPSLCFPTRILTASLRTFPTPRSPFRDSCAPHVRASSWCAKQKQAGGRHTMKLSRGSKNAWKVFQSAPRKTRSIKSGL